MKIIIIFTLSLQVKENSQEGSVVSEISVEDPDNKLSTRQSFTFELLDDAKGRFQMKGSQLLVKTSNKICGKSVSYDLQEF